MIVVVAIMLVPGLVALGFQFACFLRYKQTSVLASNTAYGSAAGQHC